MKESEQIAANLHRKDSMKLIASFIKWFLKAKVKCSNSICPELVLAKLLCAMYNEYASDKVELVFKKRGGKCDKD